MTPCRPLPANPPPRGWTEADLEALPDDGYNHEVVNGELVISPKNNFEHGQICARLSTALMNHVTEHKLRQFRRARSFERGLGPA